MATSASGARRGRGRRTLMSAGATRVDGKHCCSISLRRLSEEELEELY